MKVIGAEDASNGENAGLVMSTAMSAPNVRMNVQVQGLGPKLIASGLTKYWEADHNAFPYGRVI